MIFVLILWSKPDAKAQVPASGVMLTFSDDHIKWLKDCQLKNLISLFKEDSLVYQNEASVRCVFTVCKRRSLAGKMTVVSSPKYGTVLVCLVEWNRKHYLREWNKLAGAAIFEYFLVPILVVATVDRCCCLFWSMRILKCPSVEYRQYLPSHGAGVHWYVLSVPIFWHCWKLLPWLVHMWTHINSHIPWLKPPPNILDRIHWCRLSLVVCFFSIQLLNPMHRQPPMVQTRHLDQPR